MGANGLHFFLQLCGTRHLDTLCPLLRLLGGRLAVARARQRVVALCTTRRRGRQHRWAANAQQRVRQRHQPSPSLLSTGAKPNRCLLTALFDRHTPAATAVSTCRRRHTGAHKQRRCLHVRRQAPSQLLRPLHGARDKQRPALHCARGRPVPSDACDVCACCVLPAPARCSAAVAVACLDAAGARAPRSAVATATRRRSCVRTWASPVASSCCAARSTCRASGPGGARWFTPCRRWRGAQVRLPASPVRVR